MSDTNTSVVLISTVFYLIKYLCNWNRITPIFCPPFLPSSPSQIPFFQTFPLTPQLSNWKTPFLWLLYNTCLHRYVCVYSRMHIHKYKLYTNSACWVSFLYSGSYSHLPPLLQCSLVLRYSSCGNRFIHCCWDPHCV